MRKILLLSTLLTTSLTYGQVDLNEFEEIVLVDYQNWSYNTFYGRTYLIKLNESPIKLYDLKILTGTELMDQLKIQDIKRWEKINSLVPDSIERFFEEMRKLTSEYKPSPEVVKEVELEAIEELKTEILKKSSRGQILSELRLTKDSISRNLDNYLVKYLTENKIKYKPERLKYCKDRLVEYDLFEKTAMSITHKHATEDYPTVSIELRNKIDTLKYYTNGQHSFMLPWFDDKDKEYSYNPNLSRQIAVLLPDFKYSNRERLLGQRGMYGGYITELYFRTIERYCIDKKKKLITQ